MANFDASTPQLKLVKTWIESLAALDMNKVGTLLTRNFKYQSFPKTTDVPELTKETVVQWFGGIFASMTKMEVRIRRLRTTFELAD
jgi:hypothetical protein